MGLQPNTIGSHRGAGQMWDPVFSDCTGVHPLTGDRQRTVRAHDRTPLRRRALPPRFNRVFGVVLLILIGACPVRADLAAVSGKPAGGNPSALTTVAPGGDPTAVAVSLANGYPIWYGDGALRLQLCLDTRVEVVPGVFVEPCEFAPPVAGAPPSFPGNFGSEAFYWSAAAVGTYTSSTQQLGSALLVMAQEAGAANEGAIGDGSQAVFSRIRIRVDVPVAGTYRVTHPFGMFDYVVTTPGARAINQTQDLGILTAQEFLLSMTGAAPAVPNPFIPSVNAGIVNASGQTVGPFLVPAAPHGGIFNENQPVTFAGGPITVLNGARYIGLPFAPNPTDPNLPLEVNQPITGGAFLQNGIPVDRFRIELLNPPGGFTLNAAAGSQVVEFSGFQLVGKLFDDGPNLRPLKPADVAVGVPAGATLSIDVFPDGAADIDPVGAGNVHGIDLKAIAVADANGPILNAAGMPELTADLPTAAGGTVRRVASIPTGKTTFLYTPPAGNAGGLYTGADSFQFVAQDTGGLVSPPATVNLTVEDLRVPQAQFRSRTGKWRVSGTSSDAAGNAVTLRGSARARLTGQANVPPAASAAGGSATLREQGESIGFALQIDPLPTTPVTDVTVRLGTPGELGPDLFVLFFDVFDGAFTGRFEGVLTPNDLLQRPAEGIGTFTDALAAVREGRAYVSVQTGANPAGELRGQLSAPVVARVAVRPDGSWEFNGKSTASPGSLPGVSATSANGVRTSDTRVQLR